MLNEFRSTSITWDKATRRIYSPITANESDSNGRKLNIQVVNSGQVENLTGTTLHLYWETKDKAQHGLDAFTASDISKGEFEIFYTTGMLSNVGELNATLVLVDATGQVVSDWFKITVARGIDGDAIQSENSFTTLTQALIDISNLETNYAPRLNDLTAQLQQNIQNISRATQPLKFGELKMPDNFIPTLPFKLFRGGDCVVRHNFDFETLKTGRQIYVDKVNGTDLETSGGKSTPFKTILYAVNRMIATNWKDFTIRVLGNNAIFYRSEWLSAVGNVFDGYQFSIVHDTDKEFYLTMGESGLSWIKDGTVYTTSRTNTFALYDLINKDVQGAPTPIQFVATVAECRNTPNSWTTEAGVVYYNKVGVAPTEANTLVGVSASDAEITLLNSRLFLENATVIGSRRSNYGDLKPAVFRLVGDATGNTLTGKYFDHKCKYIGGDFVTEGELTGNGLETIDLKESYSFNSVGAYVNRDGFNHHYSYIRQKNPTRVRECIGFQYQCVGYLNGTRDTNSNNNAFTSHEGATVLRVGCVGYETRGPVLADVGGCLSINIDCHMRDSLLENRDNYQFEDYGSGNGETYLINCSGSGDARYDLWTDLPVHLNNFTGRKVNGAQYVDYFE